VFIKIPGAASNIMVAYKTLICAAVGTLRTSTVNKQGEWFLFPPLTIKMFGTNNSVMVRLADSGIGKTVPMTLKLKFKSYISHISIGRSEDWHGTKH
jgi:hypothetical protein